MTRGAWLAQSVEHPTLDLGVMNSSPMLGFMVSPLKKKEGIISLYHGPVEKIKQNTIM